MLAKQYEGEFILGDDEFKRFQALALEHTGIEIKASSRAMIAGRFSRRLRILGIDKFEHYLNLLSQADHPERSIFIDTITTNLTHFFREPHHFKELGERILPGLCLEPSDNTPIRIWSAGCSSGQEPYSLAITAAESDGVTRPTRILCTDIHSKMVQQTRVGKYRKHELRGLSSEQIKRWFDQKSDGNHQVKNILNEMLVIKQLNLFDPWPIKPNVDVIFCRNTLIYFSPDMQSSLIKRFAGKQKTGSTLILGHSEALPIGSNVYRRVSNTVFERT